MTDRPTEPGAAGGAHPDLLGRILGPDAHQGELRVRARELLVAYDKVLSGDADTLVTDRIQSSWERALAAGVDPDGQRPPRLHELTEIRRLRDEHPLAPFVPALAGLLADDSVVGAHIMVIASAAGEVLWRVGSPDIIRLAESLEFVE